MIPKRNHRKALSTAANTILHAGSAASIAGRRGSGYRRSSTRRTERAGGKDNDNNDNDDNDNDDNEEIPMPELIDYAQLVAAIGDAIVIADARGAITLWNPAAQRMFGYTEAEALGQSLDLIIPERLRARHWQGYDKTMASGITRYGSELLKVPAIDKDGKAMSIAFTVALLKDAAGTVTGIVAVIRDETVRFQQERALKKRLAELESQVGEQA
ncbi:PAS sensor protein [Cupriavidus sp. HPC(L)]|nr:PAS sensor protein [Cupriavidus sp. HPC(L)]